MVNLPPDQNEGRSSGPLRDKDEAIAIAIAFLSIGTILWWGWSRAQRFAAPLLGGTSFLEEPFMTDEPIIDLGNDDNEDLDDEGAFAPFLGRENAVVEEEAERRDRESGLRGFRRQSSDSERDRAEGTTLLPAPIVVGEETPIAEPDEASAVPGTSAVTGETSPEEAAATAPTTTPPPLDISDVSEDYWAYPYIVDLFEEGLLPDFPSGQLQPDRQLTRAEFAALLNSSFVQNEPGQRDLNFSDIPQGYWATDAIQQVVDAGYMSGYPDGTFRPDETMPRYQVLVTLASGLNLADPGDPQAVLNVFQGADNLPDWSRSKVAAAAENKIVVNYPNPQELAPQQPATRGEIIVMIHQALLNQGRVNEISSPYVNPQEQ